MARWAVWLGAVLLAACSAAPDGNNVAVMATEEAPAKPFVPLTAAQIRARLPGHYVDEGGYSCMNGPILVLADGSFDTMTETTGRTGGEYEISDGKIVFNNRAGPENLRVTMMLFRDQRGTLYYHYGESGDPRPAVLKPADTAMLDGLCKDGAPLNMLGQALTGSDR